MNNDVIEAEAKLFLTKKERSKLEITFEQWLIARGHDRKLNEVERERLRYIPQNMYFIARESLQVNEYVVSMAREIVKMEVETAKIEIDKLKMPQ